MKNYLFFGGRFRLYYAYVDRILNGHFAAASLFYRNNVPVVFGNLMEKEGADYCLVFCYVRRKFREQFEKALGELPGKLALIGSAGYEDICAELMEAAGEDCAESRTSGLKTVDLFDRCMEGVEKVFGKGEADC